MLAICLLRASCLHPLIWLRLRPSIHLAALTRKRLELHRYDVQRELHEDINSERNSYAAHIHELLMYSACFRFTRNGGPNLHRSFSRQLVVDDVMRHVWRPSDP